MRLLRALFFLLLAAACFPLRGQSPTCPTVIAPDGTVCTGQCITLVPTIIGLNSTTAYVDSTIPYSPYSFTGGNPVIVNLDDVWSPAINLPFCFQFYGATYSQIVIGTNGIVTFDATQANGNCPWSIGGPIPNPAYPHASIMAPFHDIDPTIPTASGQTSINWNVYGTAPCRAFVVSWNDVALYGNSCDTMTSTSQVVLYESSNMIDIYIRAQPSCPFWNNGGAIEGIQDATGTFATPVPGRNFPPMWTASNDGVRYYPVGPPNYAVQWLDPAGNVIGTAANQMVCPTQTTTYTLQVTENTCNGPAVFSDQSTVTYLTTNLAATDTAVMPLCGNSCNGSMTVLPTGGNPPYTYNWSPSITNTASASGLCPGLYTCIIIDANGCAVSVQQNLVAPAPFVIGTNSTPSVCAPGTGSATANVIGTTGPFTYQWSTGDTTSSISGLLPGQYQVVVTDSTGCADSVIVTIVPNGIQGNITQTPLLCHGDCNALLTATPTNGTGPYTYQWLPLGGNAQTSTGLCSGSYTCTITDATGCSGSVPFYVTAPPQLFAVPNSNLTICNGDTVTITANATGGTPPYFYTWNSLPPGPVNTISPSQTTIYTVTVMDGNGCTNSQSTLVKVNPSPNAAFSASDGDCPPTVIHFINSTDSAVSYYWDFGDPASGANDTSTAFAPSHMYTSAGAYDVTLVAVNAYGCADTLIVPNAASTLPAPNALLTVNSQVLTSLDPVSLFTNGTTGGTTYYIDFGDGDTLLTTDPGPYPHTYDTLGTFTVTLIATNQYGCLDTTQLTLEVQDVTTCYIPNAFTPNADGTNDLFMVYGANVSEFELLIFDRWGELIYSTTDMSHGWDGTFKGRKCQEDVYVWVLHYTDNLGGKHKDMGHVSLIR